MFFLLTFYEILKEIDGFSAIVKLKVIILIMLNFSYFFLRGKRLTPPPPSFFPYNEYYIRNLSTYLGDEIEAGNVDDDFFLHGPKVSFANTRLQGTAYFNKKRLFLKIKIRTYIGS